MIHLELVILTIVPEEKLYVFDKMDSSKKILQ